MPIHEAEASHVPGIARVDADAWRTTYAGVVPQGYLDAMTYENRERAWRANLEDPGTFAFGAVDRDKVVGFVHAGPNRGREPFEAEIYALYVRADSQRRGCGRLLVRSCFRRCQGRSIIVWVHSDNPSRGFYERMGAVPAGERVVEIGGARVPVAAYGFSGTTASPS